MQAISGWRIPAVRFAHIVFLTLLGFLLGPAAEEAFAAGETLHLRDDSTGGDCGQAGDWDAATRTCTLTGDFHGKFMIDSDNITLDGAGYSMIGTGPTDPAEFVSGPDGGGDGVHVYRRRNVTVRNIVFSRYDYSINLVESSNITVSGNSSTLAGLAGISLHTATDNILTNNTISNIGGINTGICIGYQSNNNTVTGNTISDSARGIYLHTNCTGNRISGNNLINNNWGLTLFEADSNNLLEENTVTGGEYGIHMNDRSNGSIARHNIVQNSRTGIFLNNVTGASVYQNSFLANALHAAIVGGGQNSFHLPLPNGGNYWSDFDSWAEGCSDMDNDGSCDAAYSFPGGGDQHAWLLNYGWLCGRPLLSLKVIDSRWASYSDYLNRLLSIDWKITNLGTNTAHDIEVSFSPCTNGVTMVSSMPDYVGSVAAGLSLDATFRYLVPPGVASFRSGLFLNTADACGATHCYPPSGTAGA